MKRLYYLIFFLFFLDAKSQDLNQIKKNEVILLYFDNSNHLVEKQTWSRVNLLEGKKYNSYAYFFYKEGFKNRGFFLVYNQYLDFDAAKRNDKAIVFDVNKSFLRKNKNIILNTKLLKKIGFARFLKLFQDKKIFLIEKSINRKKITIREVVLHTEIDE